jgi:hypothetical protein
MLSHMQQGFRKWPPEKRASTRADIETFKHVFDVEIKFEAEQNPIGLECKFGLALPDIAARCQESHIMRNGYYVIH